MSLVWRHRKRLDRDTDLTVSKFGGSLSRRAGRRLRLNSHRGGSFRIARGLAWRFRRRR